MSSRRALWPAVGLLLLALLTAACTQKMALQPYHRPYTPSDVFADGSSARPIPPDTVARGHTQDDTLLFTGKDHNGQNSTEFPFPISRDLLERGHERFDIYCVPCHGYTGDGDGVVVQRGFNPPASYNSDPLRQGTCGSFLRRGDKRFRSDAELRVSNTGGGPLGDHCVHPRPAAEPERISRRRVT